MSKIRQLRPADLPALVELSTLAGWNQTSADWERLLTLAPDGCFGIEEDGRVVSSTSVICYANELAWIGMVLTHPDHRGQGNARSLLDHGIRYARGRGVAWAKLDATDEGKPIYAKAGFVDECPIERWKRSAGPLPFPALTERLRHYIVDPSFDRAYFGAYRVPLLNALLRGGESAYLTGFGYAMSRPGSIASYFGPCVVRTRDAARVLLRDLLARQVDQDVFWDLFPDNSDAVQLAIDHGFQPARHLTRMALALDPRPAAIPRHNSCVFAIAGFEYG